MKRVQMGPVFLSRYWPNRVCTVPRRTVDTESAWQRSLARENDIAAN